MIEGENLFLRTVREGDLVELYYYLDSIRTRGEFLPSDLLSEYQFRRIFAETGFWQDEKGTLLVVDPEGRLIGALWFEEHRLFDCYDLHFLIFSKEERGRGLMTEALSLFVSYLFLTKKIQRLQISVPDYCKAALRVAQKCKFQFEGIARQAFFHRGKYLDLCIYSIVRDELEERALTQGN